MRRSIVLLALSLLPSPGCSGLVAEFPRMPAGSPGMVGPPYAQVFHEAGRRWKAADPEFDDIMVRGGDRLVVLEDAGDVLDPERKVRVRMESGANSGRAYLVERRVIVSTPRP